MTPVGGAAPAGAPGSTTPRLRIVIPTRNRADLAANAARSVVAAREPSVDVLLSDNSTSDAEQTQLAVAAAELMVTAIRPPAPLAMAAHWEWAIRRALEDPTITHVAVLTDRTLFQPGSLGAILNIVRRYPNDVVTYGHDLLNDYSEPPRLEQVAWTGRVLRIDSDLLCDLAARARHWLLEPVLPRLLNSVVPRHVIEAVTAKFGAACGDSISPDYAFAFRCLGTVDSIIYYDRPALLPYALDRSNGASTVFGTISTDHADFLATLKGAPLNPAAPIPGVSSVVTAVLHEYNMVRGHLPGLPAVEWDRFLDALTGDARAMEPGGPRDTLLEILRANGRSLHSSAPRRLARFAKKPARVLWRAVKHRTGIGQPDLASVITPTQTRDEAHALALRAPRLPYVGPSSFELDARRELGRGRITKLSMLR